MHTKTKMAQSASKSCEICLTNFGKNFCDQCKQLFCDECKTSHLRTSLAKTHTFRKDHNTKKKSNHCKQHDIPNCEKCATAEFKKRNLQGESTETLTAELETKIRVNFQNIQLNITEIDQGKLEYQCNVKDVIQAIQSEGCLLKELIDKKVNDLIKAVKEKESKYLLTSQSISNELKNALTKANAHQKAYSDAKRLKNTAAMMNKLRKMNSEFRVEGTKKIPEVNLVTYVKRNAARYEVDKLFGVLGIRYIIFQLFKTILY